MSSMLGTSKAARHRSNLKPTTDQQRTAARSSMSWDQEVFDPIPATGGKPLVTLRDAARFILKLPEAGARIAGVGDRRRMSDDGQRPEAYELPTACRNIGRAIDLAVVRLATF